MQTRPTFLSFLKDKKVQRNVWALLKLTLWVGALIALYTVVFHAIMVRVEQETHSWLTGVYWVLTTMTTVGYGDIVFASELGRAFSILVLMTGIVLIFIVLPFTFIRFFYAPWLESQLRRRIPRELPKDTSGHIIIASYDPIASRLISRLNRERTPYYVIESDLEEASRLYMDGISVVMGEMDDRETYEALRADRARMIFANRDDPSNVNITLTVREVAPETPVVAIARQDSAANVLERSGATHVLPLNRWLGEQLANRVNASHAQAHVIGSFRDLQIAELPVHQTPLIGKTIRETNLRETAGVNVIGVWQRGRLHPARPEMEMTPSSVPVVIGTEQQLGELDYLLSIYDVNPHAVIVVGAGNVGKSAARALRRKEVPVHMIERDATLAARIRGVCQQVFHGDATETEVLREAGIEEAPSLLLTMGDDAMNIFVTSLARELNPDLRIVSRITNERNIEAIHEAGADFVLGSASLGIEATVSILAGKELVVLGQGVDLLSVTLPSSLQGKTLAESDIGAKTGLNVLAIEQDGELITNPKADTQLETGAELLVLGNSAQRQKFLEVFGS